MQERILKFADDHRMLGPILWILNVQYLLVQLITAAAWPRPYSWNNNYISDLGNTQCGLYDGLYVCSPLYWLMNASFIGLGLAIAVGAFFMQARFIRSKLSSIGFGLMMLAGFGSILVGLYPENSFSNLHMLGAFFGLVVLDIAIVVLGCTLNNLPKWFRIYTLLIGATCLIAFILFYNEAYLGIGRGLMERIVSYPLTIWLISFGALVLSQRKSMTL